MKKHRPVEHKTIITPTGLSVAEDFKMPGNPQPKMPEGSDENPERVALLRKLHAEIEVLAAAGIFTLNLDDIPVAERTISGITQDGNTMKERRIDGVIRMFTGDILPFLSGDTQHGFRWQGHVSLGYLTVDDLKKLSAIVSAQTTIATGGRN